MIRFRHPSLARDLLADGSPSDTGTIRFPYSAGVLATGDVADLVAYGRSLGLTVEHHKGGGWLIRRGWIVAKGHRHALSTWIDRVITIIDWSDDA